MQFLDALHRDVKTARIAVTDGANPLVSTKLIDSWTVRAALLYLQDRPDTNMVDKLDTQEENPEP